MVHRKACNHPKYDAILQVGRLALGECMGMIQGRHIRRMHTVDMLVLFGTRVSVVRVSAVYTGTKPRLWYRSTHASRPARLGFRFIKEVSVSAYYIYTCL